MTPSTSSGQRQPVRFAGGYWQPAQDGDDRARGIFNRHYSRRHYKDGRKPAKFIGPGEYMALLTQDCQALFVWRKFISDDGQDGINCSVFRNEGPILSSILIEEACELAWQRWPRQRLYTYVAPAKIKSVNPGYCFKQAGWRTCGRNKDGRLVILERLPE